MLGAAVEVLLGRTAKHLVRIWSLNVPRFWSIFDQKHGEKWIFDDQKWPFFIKSVETEDICDERGVPFQIFYGISGNDHAFWSIANARKVIDYTPEDNSAVRFSTKVAEHMQNAQKGAAG